MNSSNENIQSGVITRAIEDWLTKTSELGYQTAFCHLLNAMGYTVIHSTTHGPLEEGKDIIALDKRKRACAFQLKRGKITTTIYRNIRPELVELVENKIKHPCLPKVKKHKSFLVTTGHIDEYATSLLSH